MTPRWHRRLGIRFVDSEKPSALPPVFLLHGLGNSLFFWQGVFDGVASGRRVVAIDIPGFGKSRAPSSYTLDRVTGPVAALMDDLGIDASVLVGHSMGAVVALDLAARHPHKVHSLVLINGHLIAAIKTITEPFDAMRRDPRLVASVAAQFGGGLVPMSYPFARALATPRHLRALLFWPYVATPTELDPRAVGLALQDNGGLGVIRALRLARDIDVEALMARVERPTSLVWGERDRLLRPDDLRRVREVMTVVEEVPIAGVGHWPMIEAPAVTAKVLAELGL